VWISRLFGGFDEFFDQEGERLTSIRADEQGPRTLWKGERDVVKSGLVGTLRNESEILYRDERHGSALATDVTGMSQLSVTAPDPFPLFLPAV